jgi:hypothetical protein
LQLDKKRRKRCASSASAFFYPVANSISRKREKRRKRGSAAHPALPPFEALTFEALTRWMRKRICRPYATYAVAEVSVCGSRGEVAHALAHPALPPFEALRIQRLHISRKRDLRMRVKRNHNVRKETCMYASEIACSNHAKSIMRY